ncbi:hypothetical protein JCM10369A_41910 [Nocardioides pyridinolyticus]
MLEPGQPREGQLEPRRGVHDAVLARPGGQQVRVAQVGNDVSGARVLAELHALHGATLATRDHPMDAVSPHKRGFPCT